MVETGGRFAVGIHPSGPVLPTKPCNRATQLAQDIQADTTPAATQQKVQQQLQTVTHSCCVTSIPKQQSGREWLQVLRLGQLGNQALRVHIDPLLLGARAQVEVQAALKALLDEGGVHGHLAQAVKGLRGVVRLVFIIQQLLRIPFFLHTSALCLSALGEGLHRPFTFAVLV